MCKLYPLAGKNLIQLNAMVVTCVALAVPITLQRRQALDFTGFQRFIRTEGKNGSKQSGETTGHDKVVPNM